MNRIDVVFSSEYRCTVKIDDKLFNSIIRAVYHLEDTWSLEINNGVLVLIKLPDQIRVGQFRYLNKGEGSECRKCAFYNIRPTLGQPCRKFPCTIMTNRVHVMIFKITERISLLLSSKLKNTEENNKLIINIINGI